jgi:hypothetical protein
MRTVEIPAGLQGGDDARHIPTPLSATAIQRHPIALQVVTYGVDTMDSCNPTRIARHGTLFTRAGLLRIKSGRPHTQRPLSAVCFDRSTL